LIKIAGEATMAQTQREHGVENLGLLEAAAEASKQTGYAIEMHTEKGSAVEEFLQFFVAQNLSPQRLVFCHVDKRPDFGLHAELAAAGAMLEYDTFYRSKYGPDKNVWPLIEKMVHAGYGAYLALATDMAESSMWQRLGGQPGLVAFMTQIKARLESVALEEKTIHRLLGGNILRRLATAVECRGGHGAGTGARTAPPREEFKRRQCPVNKRKTDENRSLQF
jgi:phosphotriesterase-related protein